MLVFEREMALSKPQLDLQAPIKYPFKCEFCGFTTSISWKCLTCFLLMCSECKNAVHLYCYDTKTNEKHIIIAIPAQRKDLDKVDITIVKEYQTKLDGIFQLAISLEGLLWIGNGHHKKVKKILTSYSGLQKVKCEGNKLAVISSYNIDVHGIAVTPNDDLLIATNGPILKQIRQGTTKIIDTVYDLKSGQPVSIHVTRKNCVIVGIYTTEGKGMVIVMDHEGSHGKVYGDNQNISFSFPRKITSTNDGYIFVIDQIGDEYEGKVAVLGKEHNINIYYGIPVINTKDRPFTPFDITTTPADNVIVVDINTSTLHILNSSGQLLTYISTEEKEIPIPCSIGITMAGPFCMLYVGTTSINNSKLYKLNLIAVEC